MRNHYDMQREVIEAARNLIGAVELHGDTLGLDGVKLKLAESTTRFPKDELEYLNEIVRRAELMGDDNEDWILAQPKIFNNRFRRFLTI
jgi:hypothetical protein